MGGLVQGAALGAAFDLLFTSVIHATQRVACFSSDFNRLKSKLCSIKLVIDDVENFNRILERPLQETQIFTDRLIEGEKLIRRCSKINVAALHFRESKRISVVVSNLEEKINELTSIMKTSQICGCNSMNDFAESVVGNKEEMQLRDGEEAVELSAAGGCGEITVGTAGGQSCCQKFWRVEFVEKEGYKFYPSSIPAMISRYVSNFGPLWLSN